MAKSLITWLEVPQEKKNVIRFDAPKGNEKPLRTVYVDKEGLKELGNPARIKVTIEAA